MRAALQEGKLGQPARSAARRVYVRLRAVSPPGTPASAGGRPGAAGFSYAKSGGLPQIAFRPDDPERREQMVDFRLAMQRRGRQAHPLGVSRHGRIVYQLHVDAEFPEKPIAISWHTTGSPTINGTIWLGLSRCEFLRQSRRRNSAARSCNWRRSMELFLRRRMVASATAGGNAVVKIKAEAELRTKSISAAEPAILLADDPKPDIEPPGLRQDQPNR